MADLCFLFDRPGWGESAACRGLDPDWFHPVRGEPTDGPKAVCDGCPVSLNCLAYAMQERILIGVWGGTSARERRQMLAAWPKGCPRCGSTFVPNGAQNFCTSCKTRKTYTQPIVDDAPLCGWCREAKPLMCGDYCGWVCERSARRARTARVMA